MTITVDWQTATDVTAQAMRYGLGAAMLKSSAATPRAGVLRTDALTASAAGGSMDVSVSAGQAMIAGYVFTSDDTTTVTLDVGGATARTDLIVARVYDEEAGDASTEGAIEVVKGTSSSVPDTPDRAIALASVAVAASASTISGANLTDKRQFTTGQGGLLWLPGGLAAAVPSWLDDGAAIWDSSADQIGVNDGGTWKKFADVGSLIGSAVTSGLTITAGSNCTVGSYEMRKIAGWLRGRVAVTYNGTDLTANSVGNILGNPTLFTMPSGWRRASSSVPSYANRAIASGSEQTFVVSLGADGTVSLAAGTYPSSVLTSGTTLYVDLDYPLDG